MDLNKLMEKLNEISYGWIDINGTIHTNIVDRIQELYRVSSIEEILTYKVRICFDQVKLERYFLSNEYITKSYAIICPHMGHSFLVLEKDNNYIYFEHSAIKNRGIYYFNNIEDLLKFTIDSFVNRHNITSLTKIKLIEYPPLLPNTTFDEIKAILLSRKGYLK